MVSHDSHKQNGHLHLLFSLVILMLLLLFYCLPLLFCCLSLFIIIVVVVVYHCCCCCLSLLLFITVVVVVVAAPTFWTPRNVKIHHIFKSCSTSTYCARRQRQLGLTCMRDWYRDWQCIECCQGDRCNFYVTVRLANLTPVTVIFEVFKLYKTMNLSELFF